VHETARLRVNLQMERAAQEARDDAHPAGEVDALADLNNEVNSALTKGASIQCPSCGVQAVIAQAICRYALSTMMNGSVLTECL